MVYLLMIFLLALLSLASWLQVPSYVALLIGTIPFFILARLKGYSSDYLRQVMKQGFMKPVNVYLIVTILGATIAMWLAAGTLPLLIYLSIQFISPRFFILIVFLVTWLMTSIIGSAIGTTGMVGVLFISLARVGDINLSLTAGAILSAIYLGERSSLVSSCAHLVSDLCHLKTSVYIRKNMSNASVSLLLILILYGIFSIQNPINLQLDDLKMALAGQFSLHPLSLLPLIILAVALAFRIKITQALLLSTFFSFIPAYFVEHQNILSLLNAMLWGYHLPSTSNTMLLSLQNKGVWGMLQSTFIVMAASLMTGLFEGTTLLSTLKKSFDHLANARGNFVACFLASLLGAAIGCSQTFAILFADQMMTNRYPQPMSAQIQKANHLADSAVVVSGLIPWNLACAVPLSLLNVSHQSLLYAVALYLLPLGAFLKSKDSGTTQTFQNYIR